MTAIYFDRFDCGSCRGHAFAEPYGVGAGVGAGGCPGKGGGPGKRRASSIHSSISGSLPVPEKAPRLTLIYLDRP
jgi:hypothetical protein